MRVFVATVEEYVPDCPAILEVTTTTILGVYTTKPAAEAATERFKMRRREIDSTDTEEDVEEDFDGFTSVEEFEMDEVRQFYPSGAWPI